MKLRVPNQCQLPVSQAWIQTNHCALPASGPIKGLSEKIMVRSVEGSWTADDSEQQDTSLPLVDKSADSVGLELGETGGELPMGQCASCVTMLSLSIAIVGHEPLQSNRIGSLGARCKQRLRPSAFNPYQLGVPYCRFMAWKDLWRHGAQHTRRWYLVRKAIYFRCAFNNSLGLPAENRKGQLSSHIFLGVDIQTRTNGKAELETYPHWDTQYSMQNRFQ
jgi:hypothetical protein